MTDESYVFEQTVKDRKRTARGAYAKKGGSRSKRCSLPSDNLTAKQRKELNGEMKTYSLNQKMTWVEFLEMPKDLQLEYLDILTNRYGGRRMDIAFMFGVSGNTLGMYCKNKLDSPNLWTEKHPRSMRDEWAKFLASGETLPGEITEPAEEEKVAPAAPSAVKLAEEEDRAEIVLRCLDGTIRYEGDPAAIFTKVLQIMEPGKNYGV